MNSNLNIKTYKNRKETQKVFINKNIDHSKKLNPSNKQ